MAQAPPHPATLLSLDTIFVPAQVRVYNSRHRAGNRNASGNVPHIFMSEYRKYYCRGLLAVMLRGRARFSGVATDLQWDMRDEMARNPTKSGGMAPYLQWDLLAENRRLSTKFSGGHRW